MSTWHRITTSDRVLSEFLEAEIPGAVCPNCGAVLWAMTRESREETDGQLAACENCNRVYFESEDDDGELLDDWHPDGEEGEPDDLSGKSAEELDTEMSALRTYIQSRRDDVFPADAEEEADLQENLRRYGAALEAAREEAEQEMAILKALADALDDNDKTALLVLAACKGTLPMLDLSGRFTERGLLREDGTLSELGMAVARLILRDDPEAL